MNDKHRKEATIIAPSRESILAAQFNLLLNASNLLLGFLSRSSNIPEGESLAPKNDGGIKAHAELAAMALMDRLETIAKDEKNWSLQKHEESEQILQDMYRENIETLRASRIAAYASTCPHNRWRPALLRHPEGGWVAALGDLSDPKHLIAGWGASPADALEEFDKAFLAADPQFLKATLEKPPLVPEQKQIETKPSNRKKKNE